MKQNSCSTDLQMKFNIVCVSVCVRAFVRVCVCVLAAAFPPFFYHG